MNILKGNNKMGIISSDTLEGSDTLGRNAKYSDGKKKKKTLPNKSPCNQDYRRETRHGKTLLSPSQKVSGFPSLAMWARAPPAEQCPCRGRSSPSLCSVQVGDTAGWVPRGASRLCTQPPPALPLSIQWLPFAYWTCLCSRRHTMGEILQVLSLIPHCKDVDSKSPGSDRLRGVCCAGPRCLSHYIFPWYSRHIAPG